MVNSRCERHCFYCRPSGESLPIKNNLQIELDKLLGICSFFKDMGVTDIKITGGDPALWEPLVHCVTKLKNELGFRQVHVISRHPRMGELCTDLAEAGVDLINFSLDTLNKDLYVKITGREDLEELLVSISRCVEAGVKCKVNTVIMKGVNDKELPDILKFCEVNKVSEVKLLDMIKDLDLGDESYIKRLKIITGKENTKLTDLYLPLQGIKEKLQEKSLKTETIYQGGLGHPMTKITLESGLDVVVKDHLQGAWYGSVCKNCKFYPCHDALMAIRLTPDYRLQFCLLREDTAINLLPYLIQNDTEIIKQELKSALSVYEKAYFRTIGSNNE
ncbi:MAG: radical SAM protein [Melioribacteraceae bacterium]|nr:radical SAM protein [Melioribacteraceae bacterium]